MNGKPVPDRVLQQLDTLIAVWEKNNSLSMGREVTLKKLKDTRKELDSFLKGIKGLKRELKGQMQGRDDCARLGNALVVRARKGVLAFFGADSTQYGQAGGTRASQRKQPGPKPGRMKRLQAA